MTEEAPEVRELTLTKLGPDGAEAKLTLGDDTLTVETPETSPLPEWLRGEIAFGELDIAYIDPDKGRERAEATDEDEEDEGTESKVSPGFRVSRWVEITDEATGRTFDRRAHFLCDEGHVDLTVAEPFALTFLKLAGRPLPGETAAAAAESAAEQLPTGAPEVAEPVAAAAGGQATPPAEAAEKDETPAFADGDAFVAPDDDEPQEEAFV